MFSPIEFPGLSLRYVVLAPFPVEELHGLNGLKPLRSTRNRPAQMGTSVLSNFEQAVQDLRDKGEGLREMSSLKDFIAYIL